MPSCELEDQQVLTEEEYRSSRAKYGAEFEADMGAEAVRKMTGASAERLNVSDRGFLRSGLAADITVFDWQNVKDNNTLTETSMAPTGIEAVFMNGRQVKRDGIVDGSANAGVVISA